MPPAAKNNVESPQPAAGERHDGAETIAAQTSFPNLDPAMLETYLRQLPPQEVRSGLKSLLAARGSEAVQVAAIESALTGPAGAAIRQAMANWIVDDIVPVTRLVPESYLNWRAPVRDAMMFVVTHLSAPRLAPKLLEQLDLPANTSAEKRLLRLIAKVPGLQKLGQVIARNQHLRPALRTALKKLENGIRDVGAADMRAIIERQLGPQLKQYNVAIPPKILSEASVSAVVRFTWTNPETKRRERGVFKVLKPHIPVCFQEDMDFLQELAQHFGKHHRDYGVTARLIPDTFRKVRRLLQHEVNFRREQQTLVEAAGLYRTMKGVRVPRVIEPLCTPTITAITEERGIKVTAAAARLRPSGRTHVAEQLIEALVAVPLFSSREDAVFHGDPHAGNLLYDARTGELVIIDWALRERLTREQRRHLALLFLMVTLRDRVGAANEVAALAQPKIARHSRQAEIIRGRVQHFLDEFALRRLPSGADAMRLLESVAIEGVRFPAPLIMLAKVMFTLEGILDDIGGETGGVGFTIARHVAQHWITHRGVFRSPLRLGDWLTLQFSALLYGSRLWVDCEREVLDRLLPLKTSA